MLIIWHAGSSDHFFLRPCCWMVAKEKCTYYRTKVALTLARLTLWMHFGYFDEKGGWHGRMDVTMFPNPK